MLNETPSTSRKMIDCFNDENSPSSSFNRHYFNAPWTPSALPIVKLECLDDEDETFTEQVISSSRNINQELTAMTPGPVSSNHFLACSTPIQEDIVKVDMMKQRQMLLDSLNQVRKFREDFVRTPEFYRQSRQLINAGEKATPYGRRQCNNPTNTARQFCNDSSFRNLAASHTTEVTPPHRLSAILSLFSNLANAFPSKGIFIKVITLALTAMFISGVSFIPVNFHILLFLHSSIIASDVKILRKLIGFAILPSIVCSYFLSIPIMEFEFQICSLIFLSIFTFSFLANFNSKIQKVSIEKQEDDFSFKIFKD